MTERERVYPSDASDEQWAVIKGLLPPVKSGGVRGGRPAVPRRDVVDAILYVTRTGCSWRQLPVDFPRWQTVYGLFRTWTADGTMDRVHDGLRERVRVVEGKRPKPTAGIIDAQAVRGGSTVGADDRGYDAAKKVNGRKRHLIVDTLGFLLVLMVTAASVQDTHGGYKTIEAAAGKQKRLRHLWGDKSYRGKLIDWAQDTYKIGIEIVSAEKGQKGFAVQPHRWIVERTFSWLIGHRRLAADYERTPEHSRAMCTWAMIGIMSRRIARNTPGHTVTPYNWETTP